MAEPQHPGPPEGERPPAMPQWVKLTGLVVLVLLVVLVFVMLLGGNHGPGRHSGAPVPAAAGHLCAATGSGSPGW